MGPGWDRTHNCWISNQTHYPMCYGARQEDAIVIGYEKAKNVFKLMVKLFG